MSKYVVIYTGLPAADANLEVVNKSWKHWFQELGAAVVDVGNPFGPCKTVAADSSVSDGGSLKLTATPFWKSRALMPQLKWSRSVQDSLMLRLRFMRQSHSAKMQFHHYSLLI